MRAWRLAPFVLLACCSRVTPANAQTIAVSPAASPREDPLPKAWVRMDVGLSGVVAPGAPTYLGYGVHIMGLRVELPHVAFLLVPRFANTTAPAEHGRSMIRLDGSLGARYLFVGGRRSPFLGGGLTYGLTSVDDTPGADGYGAGAYVEGGWEFFRSTWYQLSTGVRADAPFYRANSVEVRPGVTVHRHQYVVPVSIDVTISVPWPVMWVR
jgi:hypothetical protein